MLLSRSLEGRLMQYKADPERGQEEEARAQRRQQESINQSRGLVQYAYMLCHNNIIILYVSESIAVLYEQHTNDRLDDRRKFKRERFECVTSAEMKEAPSLLVL